MSSRPETLYHYTDAGGLHGILTNGELWATDFRFLNDSQELLFARELFDAALEQAGNPALDPTHPAHDFAEDFGRTYESYIAAVREELSSDHLPVYVSCICESGDLLSQWRGYGTDHGYSIELKSDALDHLVSSAVGWTEGTEYPWGGLRQVLYGRDAATQVVTRALDDVRNDTNLGHYGVHAHYMALNLFASLVSVKHPGFEEEREWRLIVADEQNGPTRSRFRTSSMAIVPYIALPLDLTCIVSITVGPGRYSDARLIGLRRLLESLGVDPRLTVSDVPLRS